MLYDYPAMPFPVLTLQNFMVCQVPPLRSLLQRMPLVMASRAQNFQDFGRQKESVGVCPGYGGVCRVCRVGAVRLFAEFKCEQKSEMDGGSFNTCG